MLKLIVTESTSGFKLEGDSLVNVRCGTDDSDIVMISSTSCSSSHVVKLDHPVVFRQAFMESRQVLVKVRMVVTLLV